MELRVLRYFLAVAREENISKAAEILNVTQPTLSRQLMELEDELGAKLFIRGSRKITLTDEGLLLRKRAEEIAELVHKTEAEFLIPDTIISGDIYIGAGETDAMRIITKCAHDLQKEYPNIHFHLFSGDADSVSERIDKGLLDFGILIEPTNTLKYDFINLPAVDVWGVLMRKDSSLAEYDTLRPENLWNKPLILSRQAMSGRQISAWIRKDYEKLNIIATYNLIFNASLMVEEEMGYAITLDKLVNTTGNSPLCFKPLSPRLVSGLMLVWKKHQVFSRASSLFLERMRTSIQDK